ncbi:DUF4245 domain-containing protein [Kitasatospora sp. NPDC052896]|uniref:DUF4245 domain-containing protein n=1 Tax=Kitasatospora sp. NPDC052896 TaxID=3364061 RepID=UPI0037CA6BA4
MGHHVGVAGKGGMRGRQTVRDMILSMLAVGGVALVAYLFIPHSASDPVRVVDYSSSYSSAKRAAPYPLLAPQGLPAGWRATSVQYTPPAGNSGIATWHLGFVTPEGKYAALEQSDAAKDDVLAAVVPGYQPDGSASVDGKQWERYQGDSYRGLTEPTGTATTVVTGSASYDELAQLAAALH